LQFSISSWVKIKKGAYLSGKPLLMI